ncbi:MULTISPECIES: DUF882 domain-containing protein [unclassified Sinorhizobium]|uniref:DUF882 domain-containing protein n=1 Tax=unclassified Sinorhizobium TaxID=2613772 RepID=UPI00352487A4
MSEYPEKVLSNKMPCGGLPRLLSHMVRRAAQAAIAALFAIPAMIGSAATAEAEDRALKLFFTHTGERATITFKRDGRFDPKGLAQINRFLRDWRRNEPARMDPRLFDLVWEVYRRSGASDYIHVVSAYRSPATNNMLRNRSRNSGVAKSSQHMLGKAMDFYIPGVKLATLRALAMQMQVGGVGFYPRSGSPFVHLDVGRVRAWPRMSRQELARIFPNGRTMHLPADGRPLPGYNQAVADYRKRVGPRSIEIAATAGDDEDAESTSGASAEGKSLATALHSVPRSRAEGALALQANAQATPGASRGQSFPDLAAYVVPVPTLRASDSASTDPIQTASIAPVTATPEVKAPASLPMPAGLNPIAAAPLLRQQRAELMTALPMAMSQELAAGVREISGKALLTWALHSPGQSLGMTAPAFSSARF